MDGVTPSRKEVAVLSVGSTRSLMMAKEVDSDDSSSSSSSSSSKYQEYGTVALIRVIRFDILRT